MKIRKYGLGELLQAAARSDLEHERIQQLLDPSDTLRVLPIEITFRELNGDPIQRRMRLWNTYGYLIAEGEYWDHDGGRFWRETLAVCRIEDARSLMVPVAMTPLELRFTAGLRALGSEARHQLQNRRLSIHWAIEEELTRIGRTYPFGSWPQLNDRERAMPERSRRDTVEIWIDARDLAMTAVRTVGSDSAEPSLQKQLADGEQRRFLRENLSGQPAALTYSIRRNEAQNEYSVLERFDSASFGHSIEWEYPLRVRHSRAGSLSGTYLPIDTMNQLLEDQLTWSHWSWAPSSDPADLSTFCRGIHPSGEFTRIKNYLGNDAPAAWHDSVNAACKWDNFALIATCSLHPRRNLQLSRRLRQGRVRTYYYRLFYNGGVLVGTLLKHAWALGWADRPANPTRFTADNFKAVTGIDRTTIE